MFILIRPFLAPLLSLVLLMMASGLFNTFIPLRLEMAGFGPQIIGFVTSALYGGILIGSFWIDRFISKVGHVKAFVTFAVVTCVLVIAQGFFVNPWYWAVLRFAGGICMAGIFIAIESWLLIQSIAINRGAILSIYLAVLYAALTLGQFLINVSDLKGPMPFCITAVICALSTLPITLKKPNEPLIEKPFYLNIFQLFHVSPLGFIGGVISGMVLAIVYGLIPMYAKEVGLSIAKIGNLMAMIIFGGLSLQWPIGRWADKSKQRRKILCIVSFLSAIFSLSITFIDRSSLLFLLPLAWAFGGFSFTLYPLSMAYTCEHVEENQIIATTGGFVLSYGIGAIAGPLLAPVAMNFFGPPGLFYFLALISLLLGLIGLKRPKLKTTRSQ